MVSYLSVPVDYASLNTKNLNFNHHKDLCFFSKTKHSEVGPVVTKGPVVNKNVYTYQNLKNTLKVFIRAHLIKQQSILLLLFLCSSFHNRQSSK